MGALFECLFSIPFRTPKISSLSLSLSLHQRWFKLKFTYMEFEFGIWGILIFGFGIVYLEFGIIGFGILGILIFRVVFVNVHARILVVGFGSHVAVSCFVFLFRDGV